MQPERWAKIEKLYHEALELQPGQRAALLDKASGGDLELRREVEKLISSHEAGTLIQEPAFEVAAKIAAEDSVQLKAGQVITSYEILDRIGVGGMGEVYRARDKKLGREVAIKVLPLAFSQDRERLGRFQREARLLASLNHPNVAAIYGLEESDGMQFLVLELVTGETLAERLKKGRLPVEEALDLCRQIAEGLESAHEQGIIHRDIKPANIFITKRGHAKVLDFGLAKLTESPTEAGSAMPTAQAPEDQLTTPGTAMGTVAYMSPEQALGKELDARTDLFSLGVVLYEMATGSQPFRGETSAAISNEIINKAPTSPVRLNPDLPDELETIINKALEKDKEVRCQSAKELLTDLKRLKRDTDSGKSTSAVAAATQQGKRLWLFAVVGLGVAAMTVAVVAWFLYMRPTSQESEVALKAVPLTSYVGAEACPSFSPDGNQVAYQWNGEKQDNWDVYVQQVRGEGRLQLTTDPAEDSSPVWSPDGRYIAFLRSHLPLRTELLLISPLGGVERRLSEGRLWLPTSDPGTRFLAWSPDSKWLAVPATLVGDPEGGLYLLSIESGEKRRLTSPGQRGEWQAAFSPDGRTMVLTPLRGATHLYSLDLSDDYEPIGAPRQVTHEATESMDPVWARGGSEIIFSLGLVGHGNASLQRISVSGSGRPPTVAVWC